MNTYDTYYPKNNTNPLKVHYVPLNGRPNSHLPKTLTVLNSKDANRKSKTLVNKELLNAYETSASGATNHLNTNIIKDLQSQKIVPPADPCWFPTYDEFLENAREAGVDVPDLRIGNLKQVGKGSVNAKHVTGGSKTLSTMAGTGNGAATLGGCELCRELGDLGLYTPSQCHRHGTCPVPSRGHAQTRTYFHSPTVQVQGYDARED